MMNGPVLAGAAALSALLAFSGAFQPAPEAERAEAAAVSEAVSAAALVEELAVQLEDNFVFPEIGARYAARLRARLAEGGYASAEDPKALAEEITADLQAVHEDKHLRVFPPSTGQPGERRGGPPEASEGVLESRWAADGVAYISFGAFPGDPDTIGRIVRFLDDHAGARALILDIRAHRGGGLAEMDAIFSRIFARETELVRMDTRSAVERRHGNPVGDLPTLRLLDSPDTIVRRGHFAIPDAADSPLASTPVYLLTSSRSASAAEHFALSLKRTGRATLIGETTRGAGHYGGQLDLPGGYAVFIPVGRTYDPDTGEGWEGAGVAPDIPVPADKALDEALRRIGAAPQQARTGG